MWSIVIIIHMFGQFYFSKHNVSFFLAIHSHFYHALEDEAPSRHLTVQITNLGLTQIQLIIGLQDTFFPLWILWPLIVYQTLFTYTNGEVTFYTKEFIHWYLTKMTSIFHNKIFISIFKTAFIFNLMDSER